MIPPSRRRTLTILVVLAATVFAGCTGVDGATLSPSEPVETVVENATTEAPTTTPVPTTETTPTVRTVTPGQTSPRPTVDASDPVQDDEGWFSGNQSAPTTTTATPTVTETTTTEPPVTTTPTPTPTTTAPPTTEVCEPAHAFDPVDPEQKYVSPVREDVVIVWGRFSDHRDGFDSLSDEDPITFNVSIRDDNRRVIDSKRVTVDPPPDTDVGAEGTFAVAFETYSPDVDSALVEWTGYDEWRDRYYDCR